MNQLTDGWWRTQHEFRPVSQLARLQEEIDKLQRQYDEAELTGMGEVCQLTEAEHFVYRKWMAVAQVHELIGLELADWLSSKLGAEHCGNGNWPEGVSAAEKVMVMALFGRLAQVLSQRRLL